MPQQHNSETIADDVLKGAGEIAAFWAKPRPRFATRFESAPFRSSMSAHPFAAASPYFARPTVPPGPPPDVKTAPREIAEPFAEAVCGLEASLPLPTLPRQVEAGHGRQQERL